MIYKPTDLSPSAQTFDVKDTPVFFECKVDTSNVQARGFTIKILDSENNVVFSSIPEGETLDIKYITLIDDLAVYVSKKFSNYTTGYNLLNTGYNGTYLKIPFSVAIDDAAKSTVGINQIFYSETQPQGASDLSESGLYKYTQNALDNKTYDTFEPVQIYNGQEYKWSITLYQLEDMTPNSRTSNWDLPRNPLYYDMPLTTGTVLGSNNIRIQSALSEEIYSDYFIQLYHFPELKYDREDPKNWSYTESGKIEQIGSRVLIKSYDPTYGFIYPVTGDDGIQQQDVLQDGSRANAFQIYKRGNNKENLTAYQQAAFVSWGPIDAINVSTSSIDSYHIGDIISFYPSSSDDESDGLSYRCMRDGAGDSSSSIDNPASWRQVQYRTWNWTNTLAEPGESYGTETWYSINAANGNYTPPGVLCEYDVDGNPINDFVNTSGLLPTINSTGLIGNERIILNSQRIEAGYSTEASGKYLGSPFNGLFYPQFTSAQRVKNLTYVPIGAGVTRPTLRISSLGSLFSRVILEQLLISL